LSFQCLKKDWVAGKGTGNKRALKAIVMDGGKPGVIRFLDKNPIAWCAAIVEGYPNESPTWGGIKAIYQ